MKKTNRCVVRNQAYRRAEFSIRERHNERKNADYQNGDIVAEHSALNVLYKSCEGTYEQEFARMVDGGEISLRGLKPDAKVFDELVFDVNSAYFENHGGFDYARQFFAEAYKLAVKEVGGEEYVLSAVLHADERNRALSEQLGHDVFHYHLHVVYVPVVDKEIRWSKRCKDPALIGTVKDTVKQVSHSKKWPRFKGDNGQWVNAYSLLQDRFFEHMRAAGYDGFERGERGSTTEHLETLDYKIQQNKARAAALEQQAAQQQKQLADLEAKTKITQKNADILADIDGMGKPNRLNSGFTVTIDDLKTLKKLAKEGQKSRNIIKDLRQQNNTQAAEISDMKAELKKYGAGLGITDTMRFYQARQRAPHRMDTVIADIMSKPPEQSPNHSQTREKQQSRDL